MKVRADFIRVTDATVLRQHHDPVQEQRPAITRPKKDLEGDRQHLRPHHDDDAPLGERFEDTVTRRNAGRMLQQAMNGSQIY